MKISSRVQGILFLLMAGFWFAAMSVFVKLAGDIPAFEKALFRNLIALVITAFIMATRHRGYRPPR